MGKFALNTQRGDSGMNFTSLSSGARRVALTLLAFAALVTLLSGCKLQPSGSENGSASRPAAGAPSTSASPASGAVTITDAARQQAQDIFTSRCAACHGADGRGDGPASSKLNPKPTNFHDKTWQSAAKDQEIESAIIYGGMAVGKSPFMVGNPDLQSQPAVVAALREYIRKLDRDSKGQ